MNTPGPDYWLIGGLVAVALAIVLLVRGLIVYYNLLVVLKNAVEETEGNITAAMKNVVASLHSIGHLINTYVSQGRRHDLIKSLIWVKGLMVKGKNNSDGLNNLLFLSGMSMLYQAVRGAFNPAEFPEEVALIGLRTLDSIQVILNRAEIVLRDRNAAVKRFMDIWGTFPGVLVAQMFNFPPYEQLHTEPGDFPVFDAGGELPGFPNDIVPRLLDDNSSDPQEEDEAA